ncbi:MAG: helix-turn-helix domain-containing protein [Pseudolysinimonas sp.]
MHATDGPATSVLAARELVTRPLAETIDSEGFTPRLLALLSNALVWRESNELRRRFGLGTNDWRVISAIALRPGMPATEVSDFLAVNKAVVSKSVNTLTSRGLLVLMDGPRGSRPMYLTNAGAEMHGMMLPISMRGQDIILSGMSPRAVEDFNGLLRLMLESIRAGAPGVEVTSDAL